MNKNYKSMTDHELWREIEKRFGDKTEALFDDKKTLQKAFIEDDGLLAEHFDRISRGA